MPSAAELYEMAAITTTAAIISIVPDRHRPDGAGRRAHRRCRDHAHDRRLLHARSPRKAPGTQLQLESGAKMTGDPRRLRQFVWNLLWNATRFTPDGGVICCRVARRDALVSKSATPEAVLPAEDGV
jgi:signal transduction histidine kinase